MPLMSPNPIKDGIDEDIDDFVYEFIGSECQNFSRFVSLWNQKCFPYIYCGRNRIPEVKYYTKEILVIAKKYLGSPNSEAHQVAGIYLLYALYYIQPLKIEVKIRINYEEFKELLEFVRKLNNKEVNYCFYKLFLDTAFDFVYSDKLFSLEKIREREVDLRLAKNRVKRKIINRNKQINKLWNAVGFDRTKWQETERSYNDLKSAINEYGDQDLFEMTNFLKPLLELANQPEVGIKLESTENPPPGTSKHQPKKPKRSRAAINVLFEGSSSSDEGSPVAGTTSMPQIDSNDDSDCGGEDDDFDEEDDD